MATYEADMNWVKETWNKVEKKLAKVVPNVDTAFPYTSKDGKYVAHSSGKASWWTNGFWAGMMWLMYRQTGDETYRKIAEDCEEKLDITIHEFNELHHDVGFMWLLSSVANYRLTGNEMSKTRGMHVATLLAGRYNAQAKFIRAWNSTGAWDGDKTGWAIIDCMMNIPLLYWASDESGDPRFRYAAMSHADTAMNSFVRPDGSCNHIVSFDPVTGEVLSTPGGQGYESGSSWSRGQSWAIYGFALSYIHSGKQEYLDTAKKVAHYFIANLDETGVPAVDFRSPAGDEMKDSTAGCIAACGLIEIAKVVPEHEKALYLRAAMRILKGIDAHCCDYSDNEQSIVQKGTEAYFNKDGIHIPIIYGDYYFMEALTKLMGDDVLFW